MNDVVLINPHSGSSGVNDATVEPPLGLAYMAAVLEQDGFGARIIDANALRLPPREVLARLRPPPRVVGLYLNSYTYTAVQEITRAIGQRHPETTVLLGGPLPSAQPLQTLEAFECDGLVQGEGEHALLEIVRNLRRGASPFDGEIPGTAYRDSDGGEPVLRPPVRIRDLDALPFPAYHLLPPLGAYRSRARRLPVAAIVTSRGCPHHCSFCSKDVFGRRITYRSPANVLAEIDELVSKHGVGQIDILDDNFAQKRSRLEAILDGLIERDYGIALTLQSGVRFESLDESVLRKMKRAGFYRLAFGIESADPEVLRLCRKRLDIEHAERIVRAAKRMGFVVYGFFIIGLPGETEAAFGRTMDFAQRLDFDIANFCMALPFPGTELYRQVSEGGRFLIDVDHGIDDGFYAGKVFFEHGATRQEDVLRRYQEAYRRFYGIRKQLRNLATLRSPAELRWFAEAGWSVLAGSVRSRLGR